MSIGLTTSKIGGVKVVIRFFIYSQKTSGNNFSTTLYNGEKIIIIDIIV